MPTRILHTRSGETIEVRMPNGSRLRIRCFGDQLPDMQLDCDMRHFEHRAGSTVLTTSITRTDDTREARFHLSLGTLRGKPRARMNVAHRSVDHETCRNVPFVDWTAPRITSD